MGNGLLPAKVTANFDVAAVLEAAARSPLGIVALVTMVLGLVAYGLFRDSDDRFKLATFVMLVAGGGMLATALVREANRQSDRAATDRRRERDEAVRAEAIQASAATRSTALTTGSRVDFLAMDPDPKNLMPGWMITYPEDWFIDETVNTALFKRASDGDPEYGFRVIVEEREVSDKEYLQAVAERRKAGAVSEQYLNPAMPGKSTWSSEFHEAFVQQQLGHGQAGVNTVDYLGTPDSRTLGPKYETIRYNAADFETSSPDGEIMSAVAFFNDGASELDEGVMEPKRRTIQLTIIACKVPTANWKLVESACRSVLDSLRVYRRASEEQLKRAAGLVQ